MIPPTVTLCPNCGANVPPLPVVTRQALSGETTAHASLLIGSRPADVAMGILAGMIVPPPLFYAWSMVVDNLSGHYAGDDIVLVAMVLSYPTLLGVLFGAAYAVKRRHHALGNAIQKTLFGWIILAVLCVLGLVVLYYNVALYFNRKP
jgi:hypothetical protein